MDPILVVNDDNDLLAEMTGILNEGNYFHLAASSGEQALTMASGYDFKLVVLDLKLSAMDGDELYQRLLKSEDHYHLPVVALVDSLDGDEVEVVNRLIPQGTVTLLSKPLKREWLEDLFSRYGEKKRN